MAVVDYSRPAQAELEISIIGPGFGECLVIHAGNNAWIIVDSCRNSRTGTPAALHYLTQLGLDPAEVVRAIVLTHYHDDHIRGAAETLEACTDAALICPAGMDSREFQVRVNAFSEEGLGASAVTREISNVLEIAQRRRTERGRYPVVKALANTRLFNLQPPNSGHGLLVELYSLSPSARDIDLSLEWLAQAYAEKHQPKTRPPARSPNDLSVALLLVVGEGSILLGSDLEESGDIARGWSAIVRDDNRPQTKAALVKVPHHGGASAHLHEMWSELALPAPIAFLTPWHLGGRTLPTDTDIERIATYAENSFSAARRRTAGSKIARDRTVERTIREAGTRLTAVEPPTGIVRLRCATPNDIRAANWSVAMADGACELSEC